MQPALSGEYPSAPSHPGARGAIPYAALIVSLLLHLTPWFGVLGQPKIEVAGDRDFDLGTVFQGDQMTRNLDITNAGSGLLRIEQVAPSCGCTAVSISKNTLDRYDTAHLSITFNSGHYSGRVRKTITIVSNDPGRRNLVVSFTANVTGILQATPALLYMSHVPPDSLRSGTVLLHNIGARTVTVLAMSDTSQLTSATLHRTTIAAGDTTILTLWVRPHSEGLFEGEVALETDYPGRSLVRIKYMVEADGGSSDSNSVKGR